MKLYYIDDSYFGHSDHARHMLYKLKVALKEQNARVLLISTNNQFEKEIIRFQTEMEDIQMITSPNHILEVDVTLKDAYVKMDDTCVYCYYGTYCIIDTETKEFQRLYLNLFPDQEVDTMSLMIEELESFVGQFDPHQKNKYKS